MPTEKTIKSAFESMLFVWGDPLDAKIAAAAMNIDKQKAQDIFTDLMKEYEDRGSGLRIREINGSFQFVTNEDNFDYIRAVCTPVKERRLSQAALETLAIVAYKQPVTKSEIDSIRGIRSDRVLDGLTNKGLVEERGRGSGVGRPVLYGTTDNFLTHLDMKDLNELPVIDDIEDVVIYDGPETLAPTVAEVDPRQTKIDLENIPSSEDE